MPTSTAESCCSLLREYNGSQYVVVAVWLTLRSIGNRLQLCLMQRWHREPPAAEVCPSALKFWQLCIGWDVKCTVGSGLGVFGAVLLKVREIKSCLFHEVGPNEPTRATWAEKKITKSDLTPYPRGHRQCCICPACCVLGTGRQLHDVPRGEVFSFQA